MTDLDIMRLALEALEESVDLVRHEYTPDWRHGLPTRKAQLDGMKAGLDAHEAAIAALNERLAQPERPSDFYDQAFELVQRQGKQVAELEEMVMIKTARIVDLQTHIENLEGEDR